MINAGDVFPKPKCICIVALMFVVRGRVACFHSGLADCYEAEEGRLALGSIRCFDESNVLKLCHTLHGPPASAVEQGC